MTFKRIRVRFAKLNPLRFISHHDLMRAFERMLRRAAIPVRTTEGFNPKPRMTFAAPLPLGHVGRHESLDIQVEADCSLQDLTDRLGCQAPVGLEILSCGHAASPPCVHKAIYRVGLPDAAIPGLAAAARGLLASTSCVFERTRPRCKRVELRPFLLDLQLSGSFLEIHVAITPAGTARPEEILSVLGLDEVVASGAVIERTDLILENDQVISPKIPASAVEVR